MGIRGATLWNGIELNLKAQNEQHGQPWAGFGGVVRVVRGGVASQPVKLRTSRSKEHKNSTHPFETLLDSPSFHHRQHRQFPLQSIGISIKSTHHGNSNKNCTSFGGREASCARRPSSPICPCIAAIPAWPHRLMAHRSGPHWFQ